MKTPVPAPTADQLAEAVLATGPERLVELLSSPLDDAGHLHWDKLRYKTHPADLDHRTWWYLLKATRWQKARELPLPQKDGTPFTYVLTDRILEACEDITRRAGGQIDVSEQVLNLKGRDTYIFNALVEEAIASSQLEGASTSRRVAKEMLESRREPRGRCSTGRCCAAATGWSSS